MADPSKSLSQDDLSSGYHHQASDGPSKVLIRGFYRGYKGILFRELLTVGFMCGVWTLAHVGFSKHRGPDLD